MAKHSSTKTRGGSGKTTTKKIPILPCLASLHRAGLKAIPRNQVLSLTGYTKESLRVTLSKLRVKGMVQWEDTTTVFLTQAGWDKVGPNTDSDASPAMALTNDDAQRRIKESFKITGTKSDIFDLLLDGNEHSTKDVMKAVKSAVKPDSFRVLCSSLVSKGIVERVKDDSSGEKLLRLADICFPFGRPKNRCRLE